jgi:methylmalonyl-CoA mutase
MRCCWRPSFEKRGIAPESAAIDFGLDPIGLLASAALCRLLARDRPPPGRDDPALQARGFKGPFLTADARPYHEAGASEAQELGAALATAIAYLRALEAQRHGAGEARDAISFVLVADTDEFLTIAKFRAARLLWERVQAACGLEPKPMILHAETAWRSLTKRDPWVNLLRGTIATFSAGIGGADRLTSSPSRQRSACPTLLPAASRATPSSSCSKRPSLWRVADPAAGAGSFESADAGALRAGLDETSGSRARGQRRPAGHRRGLANGHVQAGLARQRAPARRRSPRAASRSPARASSPI